MIHLLDEALESWIQAKLRSSVNGRDIEVSFKTPDRDFDGVGPGPTINLFLWDIVKGVRSHSGRSTERDGDGAVVHRGPDPVMEFRYLVSAWGSEVRDEHRLLGELTRAVMRDQAISEQFLAPPLRTVRPVPELSLGSSGGRTLADLWSAFDGQLRAGLDLVVIMTIDAHVEVEAGEQVDQTGLAVGIDDPLNPGASLRSIPEADENCEVRLVEQVRPSGGMRHVAALRCNPKMAGITVTTSRATSVIGKDGTCALLAEPGTALTLHASEPFEVLVPEVDAASADEDGPS